MAKRLLIIDDEVDVMKMLIYRLKAKGYEILTATNAREGIHTAQTQNPDLIILDYRLPDMTASEVSKQIMQTQELKNIPIILITASVDAIESKAKECNAVDYLTKPFEVESLYEKVEKYIR